MGVVKLKKRVLLVIASKVKARAKDSDMRTSQEAIDTLSDLVEKAVDAAVAKAKADGRGTIKERDFNVKEED